MVVGDSFESGMDACEAAGRARAMVLVCVKNILIDSYDKRNKKTDYLNNLIFKSTNSYSTYFQAPL